MKKQKLKEWTLSILEALIFTLILYLLFWPYLIDGTSMENTLHTNDRVAISRIMPIISSLSYGDIVVCKLNDSSIENKSVIKRIIAMPNDHLIIKDGNVYLNNNLITEDYLLDSYTYGDIDITLSDKEYFVMGDNRSISLDSRDTGAITKQQIIGKVIFQWYPFSKVRLL